MPSTQSLENPLKQSLRFGQSIWYDGLLAIPAFEKMIREDGIRGATTNPTIFEKALSGREYDADLTRLAKTHSEEAIWRALSVRAVQEVCDAFLPIYEETKGADGFVSIEVSPLLAHDTERTFAEAKELKSLVGRKNVMIKIPATLEGIPAIRRAIAEGISVNVTLIFSLSRYREVMEAYLAGLESRVEKGLPVDGIASVASFFVSRVDSAVDKLLEQKITSLVDGERGRYQRLLGKIGIANSKAAYQEFEKTFSGARFQKLKARGASIQRPLWASTGTKNPQYSDVMYVEALMGPDTVNTIPPATLDAFRDHGKPASRLKDGAAEALSDLEALAAAGISLDAVTRELEAAGVESFSESYRKIIQLIGAKKK